jgi:hypothetical protein
MIVDFFEHGTGGASGPLDYFLGKNRDREHAKILLGDVNEVEELIDCSPYEKRYTSGCLSFYESDLNEADKAQIMRDFEKTLFPGLTPGNYRILWIEHRDKINEETGERRLELNFLIPNLEIESGKRLQPFFAKADLDRVDAFKKIVNYEHNLFDPDDPINRRSIKIAQNLPKESKEFKAQVHDEITLAICEDLIYDRKTLLGWCETVGFEVTKVTKQQISIKNPDTGRPEVFTGEFYEQNFRNTAKSTELKAEASGRYRQRAEKRYQTCLGRHEKLCEAKSKYHLERYGNGNRESGNGLDPKFTEPKNRNAIENRQSGKQLQQQYSGIEHGSAEADSRHEPTLANIAVIKPSNSRTSENQENPYFIEYSPQLDCTYFAYFEHQLRLRQQEQIRRYKRDAEESRVSEIPRGEHEYISMRRPENSQTMRTSRPDIPSLQKQFRSSAGDELSEFRSPIIEDYRRSTASIEATTASTRRSSTAYTSTISDNRRIESVHENFKRETQRSSADREEVSANNARIIRANYLSNFFTVCTRELESAVTATFKRFSEEFADRESSSQPDQTRVAEPGAVRARETNSTTSEANEREVRLSEQLSRKISGFSTANIFTALDELDRRKELQRKNDRGYDSPSPF